MRDYAATLDQMAWYSANSGSVTHAVAGKNANPWGFHDMQGNVWEWCADSYGYYPTGAMTDPVGSNKSLDRVVRGGCWDSDGGDCRPVVRNGVTHADRNSYLGFRLAAVPAGR